MTAPTTFTYWGRSLPLFDHPYNTTARNERAVEIPVAIDWLHRARGGGRGLELGNVLGHYGVFGHRVVDLYEGPERLDVFDIEGRFDWIVSISTVEHVQWDHPPRDRHASVRAIEHLRGLLTPSGSMLVTAPTGHHPTLDAHLLDGAGAARSCTLVRPYWHQTEHRTAKPYGPWANSVWIGEFEGGPS